VINRRIDVFLYGLFMDVSILSQSGVTPTNSRPAYVADFALRIGQRATLVTSSGARAYGMLVALSHEDLGLLYNAPGLERYRPEAVLVHTFDGLPVPALCYNLVEQPQSGECNPEYAQRLQDILRNLGFPREYIESVS
jgi:hypothetical protein